MKKVLLFIVLTLAVAFVFYSLDSGDSPKGTAKKAKPAAERSPTGDTGGTPDIVRKAGEMQKESYMKRAEESLEDAQGRFEDMKKDAKKALGKAGDRMGEAREELDESLQGTKQKLAEWKKAAEEAWDRMKQRIEEAFRDLERRYKKLVAQKD